MRILRFLLITILSLSFSNLFSDSAAAQTASRPSSFMIPQPRPSRGPWFEGWYVRVTDPKQQRSFATITTTATESSGGLSPAGELPGYVAFLSGQGGNDEGSTKSIEYFPERTTSKITAGGAEFTWNSPGYGTLSERELALDLPSGDSISVKFGERLPWSRSWDTWGPEGWSAYLPFLPLAWWVESLGTPVTYEVKLSSGEIWKGEGFAHVEKNWGAVFPAAWMWTQGTSADNSAHLAIAGGPLGLGPVEITSYLVGYKSKLIDLEIRPDQGPGVSYEASIDSCAGRFALTASNLRDRIEMVATASPASFAPVSIPTTVGYERNRGKESFSTTLDVRVWREGREVEHRVFEGAALEFGADFMECAAPGGL